LRGAFAFAAGAVMRISGSFRKEPPYCLEHGRFLVLFSAPLHLWRSPAVASAIIFFAIIAIHKSEGSARHFERDTHDALGLSVEFMAV
jgi:hypothetical protein